MITMMHEDQDRMELFRARRSVNADHKAGRISDQQWAVELNEIDADEAHMCAMDSSHGDDY